MIRFTETDHVLYKWVKRIDTKSKEAASMEAASLLLGTSPGPFVTPGNEGSRCFGLCILVTSGPLNYRVVNSACRMMSAGGPIFVISVNPEMY